MPDTRTKRFAPVRKSQRTAAYSEWASTQKIVLNFMSTGASSETDSDLTRENALEI